ncbi:MAG: hypothetical protein F6K28_09440 [Microcoleus sp. SIO2G3]|nr:hypothetical protein [Microcoleus sp. SIO2G3]
MQNFGWLLGIAERPRSADGLNRVAFVHLDRVNASAEQAAIDRAYSLAARAKTDSSTRE